MRYFVKCRYKGTNFHGWQRQLNTPKTIQQEIEDALSLVTRIETQIVGCGRTDTAVHAAEYYFHFETHYEDTALLLFKINQIIDKDIHCRAILPVNADAHARYDATERGYTYYIEKEHNPFSREQKYHHMKQSDLMLDKMNKAAALIMGQHSFEVFCKANTDVNTKLCNVTWSNWTETPTGYEYKVRADRFLRGMVRMIVGMCINVSRDRLSLEEVKLALDNRLRLSLDWSVPGHGLYLDHIAYPEGTFLQAELPD